MFFSQIWFQGILFRRSLYGHADPKAFKWNSLEGAGENPFLNVLHSINQLLAFSVFFHHYFYVVRRNQLD